MYYAHPLVQDLLSDTLQNFVEPLLTRWPLNKLVREKALQLTMKHIHYEDENSHYITIGCVEKANHFKKPFNKRRTICKYSLNIVHFYKLKLLLFFQYRYCAC